MKRNLVVVFCEYEVQKHECETYNDYIQLPKTINV